MEIDALIRYTPLSPLERVFGLQWPRALLRGVRDMADLFLKDHQRTSSDLTVSFCSVP